MWPVKMTAKPKFCRDKLIVILISRYFEPWDLLTIENTDLDLKCTRCIMQMSYLYAPDFPLKNIFQVAQHTEKIRKIVWEKSNNAYSLSIRVKTTINHISICFLPQYQCERIFFQSASWRKALHDTLTRAVRTLVNDGKSAN